MIREENSVEIMNMVFVYDNDKFLVENKVNCENKGVIFPGGHVEPGESIEVSAIREIKEETGLDIQDLKFCGFKNCIRENGNRYLVFIYKTNNFSGTLKSCEEGEVYWTTENEFLKSNLLWDVEDVYNLIKSNEPKELYLDERN